MINIENTTDLAKRSINCIVIVITIFYQNVVDKAFYLFTTDPRDIFLVSWCLSNNLDIR